MKKIKWLAAILIVLAAIGTGFLGYYLAKNAPSISQEKEAVSVAANQERIEKNAVLVINYEYLFCSHQKEEETTIPQTLVGKTKQDILNEYPDFRIDFFARDKIRIIKKINQYCEKHLILKEKAGRLVVLKNIPGTEQLEAVEEYRPNFIKISSEERRILQDGKVFSNESEIEAYLRTISR